MKVNLKWPTISMLLKHTIDNSLVAEIVFANADMEFLRYLDYRKDINLKAYSIYILQNPDEKSSAPFNSK